MNAHQKHQLLLGEIERLRKWLSCFSGPPARVGLMPSGQTVYVRGMHLPDRFVPDYLDIALVVDNFPTDPPIGFYALETPQNRALINQLRQKFNVFNGGAAHGAPPIQGFQWLCAGFLSGWKFNVQHPDRGDNLLKHLLNFYRLLEQA